MSIPHRRQADLQLHERVLSQLICHLMLPTFYLPGFRKSGPFPLSLKTNQIGYKPRSLAKSDDGHITILRLNNFFQVIPHNVARADSKKKRVLLKPFFAGILCVFQEKVAKSERGFTRRCRRRIVRCCLKEKVEAPWTKSAGSCPGGLLLSAHGLRAFLPRRAYSVDV